MKSSKIFGIIVLFAIIGLSMSSCVTATSIGGTSEPHGLFTGNGAASSATEGATEIASYSVIMNIIDIGYEDYAAKVKEAEAAGKQVFSVTKWFYVLSTITAYAK
jgi:hypothetical protein